MDQFVVRTSSAPQDQQNEENRGARGGISKERAPSWGSRGGYFAARTAKQRAQAPKARTNLLSGVNVYFTGVFTHSQIQLTRLVYENGGTVSPMWSRRSITHVVCDRLAASKVEKELSLTGSTRRARSWIVKPNWVLESVERGTRLPEANYAVIRNRDVGDVRKLLGRGEKRANPKRTDSQALAPEVQAREVLQPAAKINSKSLDDVTT